MKETKKWMTALLWGGGLAAGALLFRWIFPASLPFLVGLLLAWAAEPLVRVFCGRWHFPRFAGSCLGVLAVYGVLGLAAWGLWHLALREMDEISAVLPRLMEDLGGAAEQLEERLLGLAGRAPERLREALTEGIRNLFSGSAMAKGGPEVLGFATRLLGSLPDALVFLGTAVTASFLISVRFERLRPWVRERLPRQAVPTLRKIRSNLGCWLRAECKLSALTFLLLAAGLMFLRVRNAIFLAGLIALVDALPILGTGTVLIPWALWAFFRGEKALAAGLGAMYGIVVLLRSLLEPKLLGRQLGLSPLLTLAAVYLGYRFWGILGMILAPILTVTFLDLWAMGAGE